MMAWPYNERPECEHPLGCPFVYTAALRCTYTCAATRARENAAKLEREEARERDERRG